MKQFDLTINYPFGLTPKGKVPQGCIKKLATILFPMKQGDYFITDSNGYQFMVTTEKTKDVFILDCEITSDTIDWYNRIEILVNRGKLVNSTFDYESYNVM